MWPKATNVLEECYYQWRRKRWGGGGGGGGEGGYVCAPTFNPIFLFST